MALGNYKITCLFGLPDKDLVGKVNSVKMDSFCTENKIYLDKSNDWDSFHSLCLERCVDMVITLGDSRIVPKKIVDGFEVIGNHGAILPNVQGGASLVWGRMLNNYRWGVSIMRIAERVDGGEILKTKEFSYKPETTEEEFVAISDKIAGELLIEVLKGNFEPKENQRWDIRISKHTDSYRVKEILEYCLENNLSIYLPPRIPEDGKIKSEWPEDFKESFKIANNSPYPKWSKE